MAPNISHDANNAKFTVISFLHQSQIVYFCPKYDKFLRLSI